MAKKQQKVYRPQSMTSRQEMFSALLQRRANEKTPSKADSDLTPPKQKETENA